MSAVVIVSGGMDSSTLLYHVTHHLNREVKEVLSFDYGQRHLKELNCAHALADDLGIDWRLINLRSAFAGFDSALTNPAAAVPEGHYEQESMKQTVVPNRNAILLSVAVGVAVSVKADRVYYGAHAGDHAIYPDCRREFVEAFGRAMHLATEWDPVELCAPFLSKTKADIVRLGLELGVPFERTWTCYKGGEMACGVCGTCVERLEAFDLAGAEDPLVYQDRYSWKQLIQKHRATA